MIFQDTNSANSNRRRLTVVSSSGNELIVDISRYDNSNERGTPLNSLTFNQFQNELKEYADEIGTMELLANLSPSPNTDITLNSAATNYRFLFIAFLTSGSYVVTNIIPVEWWKNVTNESIVINGSINENVRYYQLMYINSTTIKCTARSNATNLQIYGIK